MSDDDTTNFPGKSRTAIALEVWVLQAHPFSFSWMMDATDPKKRLEACFFFTDFGLLFSLVGFGGRKFISERSHMISFKVFQKENMKIPNSKPSIHLLVGFYGVFTPEKNMFLFSGNAITSVVFAWKKCESPTWEWWNHLFWGDFLTKTSRNFPKFLGVIAWQILTQRMFVLGKIGRFERLLLNINPIKVRFTAWFGASKKRFTGHHTGFSWRLLDKKLTNMFFQKRSLLRSIVKKVWGNQQCCQCEISFIPLATSTIWVKQNNPKARNNPHQFQLWVFLCYKKIEHEQCHPKGYIKWFCSEKDGSNRPF